MPMPYTTESIACVLNLYFLYLFIYPNKKLAIPSKQRNSSVKVLRKTFAEEKQDMLGF